MLPALLIFVLSLFVFYCIRFMVRHGEDIPAYFFWDSIYIRFLRRSVMYTTRNSPSG